jgi:hypothetical protein
MMIIIMTFTILISYTYYIKQDEIGTSFSTHGRSHSQRILVEKPKGKRPLEDLGVYAMIILKWILKKWSGRVWTELICLRIHTKGGLL